MPTRPPLITALAIVVLALTPGAAAAKGVEQATVCGADHCVSVEDDDLTPALLEGGSPADPPSQPQGWYRVRLAIGEGRPGGRVFEHFTINVLPQSGHIRSRQQFGGSLWSDMSPEQQAIYRNLTRDLEPLPGDELKGLTNPKLPAANVAPPTLPAEDEEGSSGFPWVILVGGLAALGAVTWAALALARRRPARSDSPPAPRASA
jgi:hypothetical protein